MENKNKNNGFHFWYTYVDFTNSNFLRKDQVAYNSLSQAKKDALMEQRKKDGKSMLYIHQAMHESILPRVAVANTTKKAWDILGTSYQGLDKVKTSKLQILRRDF